MGSVIGRAGSFVAVSFVFIIGIFAAGRWIIYIDKVKGSTAVYSIIMFGLCFLYYLAIATYVFGVYPSIPANRGGRMPLTEAYIKVKDHQGLLPQSAQIGSSVLHGPIYILEQTSDSIYFANEGMDHWFNSFVDIHCLRREDITYMRLQRINDGFPRTSRNEAAKPNIAVPYQDTKK